MCNNLQQVLEKLRPQTGQLGRGLGDLRQSGSKQCMVVSGLGKNNSCQRWNKNPGKGNRKVFLRSFNSVQITLFLVPRVMYKIEKNVADSKGLRELRLQGAHLFLFGLFACLLLFLVDIPGCRN